MKKCKFDDMTILTMLEFWEMVFPIAHLLHPLTVEEASERLQRPSQLALWEQALLFGDGLVEGTALFMKAESYNGVKDPRPITVYGPTSRIRWACYMYALMDYMKQNIHWYAFGHSPLRFSERVAAGAILSTSAALSDAHRFDGNVCDVERVSEKVGLSRGFALEHHQELHELQERQYGVPGRTREGARVPGSGCRGSGSFETAPLNSLDVGCIVFSGYRRMRNDDGSHFDKKQAYALLCRGQVGGDDTLCFDIDPACLTKAAQSHGQNFKVKIAQRGERIDMLSRVFGEEVWWGNSFNTCDVLRQALKINVSGPLTGNWTPFLKMRMKALSLYLTDRYTFALGDWAAEAVRHCVAHDDLVKITEGGLNNHNVVGAELASWFASNPADEQFQQFPDYQSKEYVLESLPGACWLLYDAWIGALRGEKAGSETAIAMLMNPPEWIHVDDEIKAEHPVAVDGLVYGPSTKEDVKAAPIVFVSAEEPADQPIPPKDKEEVEQILTEVQAHIESAPKRHDGDVLKKKRVDKRKVVTQSVRQSLDKKSGSVALRGRNKGSKKLGDEKLMGSHGSFTNTDDHAMPGYQVHQIAKDILNIRGSDIEASQKRAIVSTMMFFTGQNFIPVCRCIHKLEQQINGSHGSYTGTDDHALNMGAPDWIVGIALSLCGEMAINRVSKLILYLLTMYGPMTKAESKAARKAQSLHDKKAAAKAQSAIIGRVNHPKQKGKKEKAPKLRPGVAAALSEAPNAYRNAREQPGLRNQRIHEDEFVQNIVTLPDLPSPSVASQTGVVVVQLQPALDPSSQGFAKWGQAVAVQYEQYRCVSMEFYYRPLVSAFSGAGTAGKVILAVNYDATEASPQTPQQMESIDPHVDGMPYENMVLTLDPKRLTPGTKFTRTGVVPGTDQKMYDMGRLFVMTTGLAPGNGSTAVGELRVRYTIELTNPRIPVPPSEPNLMGLFRWTNANQTPANNVPTVLTNFVDYYAGADGSVPDGQVDKLGLLYAAGVFTLKANYAYLVNVQVTAYATTNMTQMLLFPEYTTVAAPGTWVTSGTVPFANVIVNNTGCSLNLTWIADGSLVNSPQQQVAAFRHTVICYFSSGVVTIAQRGAQVTTTLLT